MREPQQCAPAALLLVVRRGPARVAFCCRVVLSVLICAPAFLPLSTLSACTTSGAGYAHSGRKWHRTRGIVGRWQQVMRVTVRTSMAEVPRRKPQPQV